MTSTTTAPDNKPASDLAVGNSSGSTTRSANRRLSNRPSQLRQLVWPLLLVGILGLMVAGLVYVKATYVSGIELNSHTWEQRTFSFRRDPFTGTQLGGVQHNAPVGIDFWTTIPDPRAKLVDPAIAAHLTSSPSTPLRWDLVSLDGSLLPGGRASILVNLLDANDRDFDPFWPKWSSDHPRRAAVLWPAVQQLVAFDQYHRLPDLFTEALLENSLEEFSSSVGQLVQQALAEAPQRSSSNVEQIQDDQP